MLFTINVDVVLFDLTTFRVEITREDMDELRRFGYIQFTVGLKMESLEKECRRIFIAFYLDQKGVSFI